MLRSHLLRLLEGLIASASDLPSELPLVGSHNPAPAVPVVVLVTVLGPVPFLLLSVEHGVLTGGKRDSEAYEELEDIT